MYLHECIMWIYFCMYNWVLLSVYVWIILEAIFSRDDEPFLLSSAGYSDEHFEGKYHFANLFEFFFLLSMVETAVGWWFVGFFVGFGCFVVWLGCCGVVVVFGFRISRNNH